MSIVVTCACTQTYRLPNRYAGKRCKCRECGERIRVPAEESEEAQAVEATPKKRKRKRARAKGKVSRDTTRRLGAEAGTIISEGKQLREGISRRRPVSESIHQLAPLHSQGMLDEHGIAAPSRRLKRRKPKGKKAQDEPRTKKKKRDKSKKKAKTRKTEAEPRPKTPRTRRKRKTSKAKKAQAKAKETTKAKVKAPAKKGTRGKAKVASQGKTRATRTKGKTAKLGRRDRDARKAPRSSLAARRGARRERDEEETPRTRRKSPTKHALMAVIAIVGVLCLGVGLIVGGAFSGSGSDASSDVDAKLEYLQKLAFNQKWDAAVAEADKLEKELASDKQATARLFKIRHGIDTMAQVEKVENPEAKLGNLLNLVRDKDPAVRLAVSLDLRKLAEVDKAQRALLSLTKDEDPRVAEASKLGMVYVGGPHSIPFLIKVIEETAGTGSKLADLAVDQALQIQDLAVTKVLVKILEVRKTASPTILSRVLFRLSEVASEPAHAAAAKPYLTHEDKRVKEAAQAVIDAVK